MANAIQLITKYATKAWDKVYKAEACSSILDTQHDLLKFEGTRTVKIARFSATGLSDYKRANKQVPGDFGSSTNSYDPNNGVTGYGYQRGDAGLEWEEFTLRIDRGAQYNIESMDDEETDGLAVAATTTEVSRTKVIPEVDAYCFSEIVKNAGTIREIDINPSGTLGANGAPITELNRAFKALSDEEVPEEDQVIFCSTEFMNALRSTNELYRKLDQTEYKGDVKFTITSYEGRKLVVVPPRRFKTLIDLHDKGYGWKAGSQDINFIVMAKSAAVHVTKYDKMRIFTPAQVQDYDGYKINIRIYHDLFVTLNKKVAIYACLKPAGTSTDVGPFIKYDVIDGKLANVSALPGDVMFSGIYKDTTNAYKIGDIIDKAEAVEVNIGDDIVSGEVLVLGLSVYDATLKAKVVKVVAIQKIVEQPIKVAKA